ncbi:MAG: CGGC domain-containing protein [bacterium]|nr:CGGC domain-containing protein [bacterium]
MNQTKYIIVLQCHIVKERCSGFLCEDAFFNRKDGFREYPADAPIRYVNITCGGCCGKATLRKLGNFSRLLAKKTKILPEEVTLHFASCICRENFHGPVCPHYDYLKELVERKGIAWKEGSRISPLAEKRRDADGHWHADG